MNAPSRVGRYMLFDALASGGMATVHLGRLVGPIGFARTVAIKRMHAHLAGDSGFTAMFLDEARLAARIHHPNVVSVVDVVSEQGQLFLVMDYVHGQSLARLLADERPPVGVALSIIVGALEGLHAAHEANAEDGKPLGLVHRDVSPQNVIVGVDGITRVVDFGIAKAANRLVTTTDGAVKGKDAYMAPEQINGGKLDRRVDTYAASVVLWEMLTGSRLFTGDSPQERMMAVLTREVDPPTKLVPTVPKELDEIVLRGLSREVGERWATAREMAARLEAVLPLVSSREVGDWVARVAEKALRERARLVATVERGGTDAGIAVADAAGADEATRPPANRGASVEPSAPNATRSAPLESEPLGTGATAATHSQIVDAKPPMTPLRVWPALLVAAMIAAFAGVGLMVGKKTSTPNSIGSPAPDTASGWAPVPEANSAAIAPSASATSPAIPIASASASASASAAPPPRRGPVVAKPAGARPGCHPPYTMKDGVKVFKPECVD